MKLTRILAGMGLLALWLAGCAPKNVEPTLDPMMIHTSVAATMSAQITQTAAAMPTITPIPPTEPPPPPPPTEALPTVAPVMVLPTSDLPTVAPTEDKAADMGILVSQIPVDGQRFNPGSFFDAIITFQNSGETTWKDLYSIRYLGYGPDFSGNHTYTLAEYGDRRTVKPDDTVSVKLLGLVAPDGYDMSHVSHWCLYNNRDAEGLPPQCFLPFTIDIFVGPEK